MKMMSRTFRYFKLIYIVAGILTSNEHVCDHVDQIRIAPRVEVKEILQPKKVYRGVEKVSRQCFRKVVHAAVSRIKQQLLPIWSIFNIWAIPNYLLDYSTNYISRKIVISSDCDVIYNK